MSPRRVWLRRLALAALAIVGLQQLWRHGHDYVFADKFAVVEPGKVFRGAWQHDWPMKRIVREYHVKTIVALAHPPTHPLAVGEKALAQELGIQWVHVPITDDRSAETGDGVSDQLEKAASVLADPASQPVYFHCHHGINRASMVQIAYRTMYCGWTLDQATEEVSRSFGLVAVSHGPDYRHMKKFYEERVLPRRLSKAATAASRK